MLRWLLIGLILLVAFGLYSAALQRTFQYDEAYTLRHFAVNPGIALLSYTEPNNHMLHSLLVWLSRTLAGESLIAIRFPAFAAALLSIAMMYHVGRRLGNWRLGVAAAVFLAINPAFAEYATNARGYTLSILLTLMLIDRVFLAKPRRTRAYRYTLLLTCCALILTLPTMVMLIAAAFAWLLWRARTERVYRLALPPIVLGSLMGALFYVPAFLVGSFSRSTGRFGSGDPIFTLLDWALLIFDSIGGILFIFTLIGWAVMVFRRQRRLQEMTFFLLGVALLAAVGQRVLLGSSYYGRNILYLLPLMCLLAGLGLVTLTRKASPLAALALLILAFPLLQFSLAQETTIDYVLEYIDTETQPGDMLLIGNFADEPIFFYLEKRSQWDRLLLTPDKQRLIVISESERDVPPLLDVYGLQPYVRDCRPTFDPRTTPNADVRADARAYLYWRLFDVQECSLTPNN